MPFVNLPSIILEDPMGNLDNFTYHNENISYHSYNKQLGKIENRIIVREASPEFDADINSAGEIFLICKKNNGDMVLLSNHKSFSKSLKVIEANQQDIYNVNIDLVKGDIHIFYAIGSQSNKNQYKIIHQFGRDSDWQTTEIGQISTRSILNPIQILKGREEIVLGYYDVIEDAEQFFIKTYDLLDQQWKDGQQLTHNKENKLYIDMLLGEEDDLHIAYSQFSGGNMVIKYEKFKKEKNIYKKKQDKEISNPANCSHPVLIFYDDKLWISWSEYNYIASRYTEDWGETWKDIYLWKESKIEDIILYKYKTCHGKFHRNYNLNYSFGKVSNLSFIGFGNLEHTSIIPMKNKNENRAPKENGAEHTIEEGEEAKKIQREVFDLMKKDIDHTEEKLRDIEEIEKVKEEIQEIQSKIRDIGKLEESLQNIKNKMEELVNEQNRLESAKAKTLDEFEQRLTNIENYLTKNTRSFRLDKKF